MSLDDFAGRIASQFNRPPVPVRQQLDTLKRLGIKLSGEREAAFLADQGRFQRPAYAAILEELGLEGSDQIYAFDSEVAEVSTMYRDVIGNLLRLTGGELDLTGAAESGEDADLENRGGVWHVDFCLNGRPYRYDAEFMGDWLDLNFFPFLNGVLEKEGAGKRFITVDDFNIQGMLVFYRTPEWGKFFAAGTGLSVKDS